MLYSSEQLLEDFFRETTDSLMSIMKECKSLSPIFKNQTIKTKILLDLHRLKGSASLIDCEKLKTLFHSSETSLINNVENKELLLSLKECQMELLYLFNKKQDILNENIKKFIEKDNFTVEKNSISALFLECEIFAKNCAKNCHKNISFEINSCAVILSSKTYSNLKQAMFALILNSIVHGIEKSKIRGMKGKNKTGKIKLNCLFENNSLIIEISDDGIGMSRPKSFESNKKQSEKSLYSGRGLGLKIVQENIKKINGELSYSSVRDFGTNFIVKCAA